MKILDTRPWDALALESENRARDVLMSFSDPTAELIPAATSKAACGTGPTNRNNGIHRTACSHGQSYD